MGDDHNAKILAKILGCHNSKVFRSEYDRYIKPELFVWLNNKPHYLSLSYPEQRGGVAYTITTELETIPIEVEILIGKDDDMTDDMTYDIVFFHPKYMKKFRFNKSNDLPFKKYCMMIKINRENRFAEISDLNSYFPCFDPEYSKFGRLMMRGVVSYCRKYRDLLGIDYLQLGDNATHYCDRDRRYPIRLSRSRQMLGQYPYYWRFGFRPNDEIIRRIKYNLLLVATIKTGDRLSVYPSQSLLEYLESIGSLDVDIKRYLSVNIDASLSVSLKYISDNYCKYYSGIYEGLYGVLRLLPLSGGGLDDVWVLSL